MLTLLAAATTRLNECAEDDKGNRYAFPRFTAVVVAARLFFSLSCALVTTQLWCVR